MDILEDVVVEAVRGTGDKSTQRTENMGSSRSYEKNIFG